MLNIIQITDCHIQPTPNAELRGVNVDTSLAAVLKHIQAHHWPVDFLLATGDLVHDDSAAYPRFAAMLEPLQVPVYCLPGNHDIPAELSAHLANGWVQQKKYIQQGDWQFFLLDTHVAGSPGGAIAPPELDFLQKTLSNHPNLPALICLHHHPVPIGSAWLDTQIVANASDFFAILNEHPQVRAVIWGHIHQVYTGHYNHYSLLAAPATSCQFTPNSERPSIQQDVLPGYRWFRLYPDGRLETGIERVSYKTAV